MNPSEALAEALGLGWSVIPIGAGQDWKKPLHAWKEFQTRAATEAEVDAWQREKPHAWAVVTGAVSGLVVVDFDGEDGQRTREAWGLKPNVLTARKPGAHVYVAHPGFRVPTLNGKAKDELGERFPGVDVKGDGGYSILCGSSVHGLYEPLHLEPYPWEFLPKDFREFLQMQGQKPEAEAERKEVPSTGGTSDPEEDLEAVMAPRGGHVLTAQAQDGLPSPDVVLRKYLAEAQEGCRNNIGFELACQLRDNGIPQAEAEAVLRQYAQAVPGGGYTAEEAEASVRQAYSEAPREPWGQREGNSASVPKAPVPQAEEAEEPGELEEGPKRSTFTLSDLLTGELEPVSWTVESLVPSGGIAMLAGDSGIYKSWIGYHLGLAVAGGLPFLGRFPTQACPVLVFDAESGESLIRRRVKKLFTGLCLDGHSLPDDLPLRVFAGPLRIDTPKQAAGLAKYLQAEGVLLVIADPLIHCLPEGANENDSASMARFFEAVRYVMGETGAGFLFTHHSRKRSFNAPSDGGQMLRGSSAIRGVLDSHLFLRKLRPGVLLAEHDKSRHAEAVGNFTIEIADPDEESTVVKWGGEAEDSSDQTAIASAFISRVLTDAGGTLKRQEIIEYAKAEGLKERTLCNALTEGVDSQMLTKSKQGKTVVYTVRVQEGLWPE